MRCLLGLFFSLLVMIPLQAKDPQAIFEAVRAGDLARVKQLVETGTPLNITDRYGLTPLAVSAQTGQLAIAKFLISKKADLNQADTFYDSTPLGHALWNQHLDVAVLLVKHGAEPRDDAFEMAAYQGNTALAKTLVAAGPIYASTYQRLTANKHRFNPQIQSLLAEVKQRKDLPAPSYSAKDLQRFVGIYEGFLTDTQATISLENKQLWAALNGGNRFGLKIVGVNTFASASGDIRMSFGGRAGTIEGFRLSQGPNPPELLRHSVAEPIKRNPKEQVAPTTMAKKKAPTIHWPAFRGTNRTGNGDGAPVPTQWNLESGEGVAWQAKLEGLGNSSPVIWGNHVFVTTAIAPGIKQELTVGHSGDTASIEEAVEHRWVVYCFDKKTGEKLWEKDIAQAKPLTQRHFKASQANSTPATNGKYVIVVFPTAGLACLDFQGNILWHHNLGGLNASAFYSPDQQWGFSASPIIYKDTVILQVDVYGGPYIAAWDLATGKQRWRTERKVATSWTTPAIWKTRDGDELVVNGSTVFGYNPRNGKELWRMGPNSELVIAAPVVGEGVVYISAGYSPIKPIYAIREGLRGAHEFAPGQPHEQLAWSHRRGGAYMPTPLLYRGYYFLVHANGRLVVYNAASGDPIHKARFSQRGAFTASPVVANGHLYIGTEEGLLYILDAAPGFKELAVHDFEAPIMATPAISEGLLFIRTPSKLIALGSLKGASN